ncbi:MAG: hypothetical protein QG560_989 [Campylobacterota bacterium]|nr:hypothetical protein [Campylobacterota bacterium]MDQ1338171.1 hypothetical protein [Campylobacterota bacterium]
MSKKIIIGTMLVVAGIVLFSGCAKSATCKSQDNSELRVSVLEDSIDPSIVTYRWNPFIGGWFSDDVVESDSRVTATMTAPAIFTIWGSKRIVMDGEKDTVYLGEDSYKCGGDLSILTKLVKKINKAKVDDRLRALESSTDEGRY